MNKNDLILSKNKDRNYFLKQCLPLEEWHEGTQENQEVKAILQKAKNSEEFIRMVLESDMMKGSQVYAELSKDRHDHWKRVRDNVSTWTETYSDIGGLKIGSENFSVNIPNGYGDGEMYYAVVGKGCFNHNMLDFWTSIRGKEINIYDYDCGDKVIETLSGRYGIFYGYKYVVFERWGDA